MPNPGTAIDHVTGPVHAGKGDIVVQYGAPPVPEPEPPAFRVLTIVARPLDQQALPEIGDAWSLADGLARADLPLDLAFTRPPTAETARRRLAEGWDVVHFDGHGVWAWTCADCGKFIAKEEGRPDGSTELAEVPAACPRCGAPLTQPAAGYLAFEQEDGLTHRFPAAELAALLCPPGSPPRARLAILTACQSAMGQPSLADVLLQAGVPAVLAMRESVTVGVVVALLPPFYANLAAGCTPRQALAAALPALRALGYPSFSGASWEQVPALLGPGADVPLCAPGCRAAPHVEREPLVGVPAPSTSGAFHGDFDPGDPPAGRKGYLVRLARTLARGKKLVVLTGVGGVGKSALAAAVARRLAWRYPGGVFWVDGRDYLQTGMRLENALAVFAAVYGGDYLKLPAARQRDLAFERLRRIEAPALVVVDNADVADETVWRFLRDVPRPSAVLATTRTAPEYGGSVVPVEALTPVEGLTFLAAEIGRRRDEVRWTAGLDDAAKGKLLEIARLLDGHALALLQAAALAGDMGLDYALAQARAHPSRGETGRRFDFSYNPLPESRKDLLHRLAAFAADFDLQAVEAVCGDDLTPRPPSLSGKGESADSPLRVGEGLGERSISPLRVGEGLGERSISPPPVGEGTGEGVNCCPPRPRARVLRRAPPADPRHRPLPPAPGDARLRAAQGRAGGYGRPRAADGALLHRVGRWGRATTGRHRNRARGGENGGTGAGQPAGGAGDLPGTRNVGRGGEPGLRLKQPLRAQWRLGRAAAGAGGRDRGGAAGRR